MTVRSTRLQYIVANGWIVLVVIAYVAIRLAGSARGQALIAQLTR